MIQALKGGLHSDPSLTLCIAGFEGIAVDTAGKVPLEQILLRNLPACASMPAVRQQKQNELSNVPRVQDTSWLLGFSGGGGKGEGKPASQPAKDFPLR